MRDRRQTTDDRRRDSRGGTGARGGASTPRPTPHDPRQTPSDPRAGARATAFPEPLYLDNHLLVVVKPAGMLSQGDRTGDTDLVTLAKAYLKERFDRPGEVFVGLVHRLDRPVSGVVVLARTSKAAARLSAQFRERAVSKRYVALVEGTLTGGGRRVDWLVKDDETVHVVRPETPGAREATLSWDAVAALPPGRGGSRTLVAVTLETGRGHQVRVQMAAMGHPVVGDRRHGAASSWRPGEIALHALALDLEHPTQRVPLAFAAAPLDWPAALAPTLAALARRAAPDAPDRDAPDRDAPDRDAPDRDAPDRDAPDRDAVE